MDGIEQLIAYIDMLRLRPSPQKVEREPLGAELLPVADSLEALSLTISEFYQFALELANGNVDATIDRTNYMAGPLKDLQSTLRAIIWQAGQAAKGDYNQRMDYLGEFSISFNEMMRQLKNRTEMMQENAELKLRVVEEREAMLHEQLIKQVEYYGALAEKGRELSGFRHDVKNHILVFTQLVESGKKEQALEYMRSITKVLEATGGPSVKSGNDTLDALLSQKLSKAKSMDIGVNCEVAIKRGLPVSDFDWCIIIGNSLDNAIEACRLVEPPGKRFIDLSMKSVGDMLSVTIKNSFVVAAEPDEESGVLKTTKSESAGHGLGMTNMKMALSKYDGSMEIEMKDGVFTLFMLMLNMRCDEKKPEQPRP